MTEQAGHYIVFEGGDAVGKSTAMELVAQKVRTELGMRVLTLEEPDSIRDETGTALVPMAETLRPIIKNGDLGRSALTNIYLFSAARRENWHQVMQRELEAGTWIVAARNWWSTVVYQGIGEGQSLDFIRQFTLEATDARYVQPDHAFILDVNEEERARRIADRKGLHLKDTFEKRPSEFQLAVGNGYRTLAQEEGIPILLTQDPAEIVADKAWAAITQKL